MGHHLRDSLVLSLNVTHPLNSLYMSKKRFIPESFYHVHVAMKALEQPSGTGTCTGVDHELSKGYGFMHALR